MAKISVFLNGNASQSAGEFSVEEFKKFFFRHEVKIHAPDGLISLNRNITDDIADGTEYIFSVGGDGTASTISQHLINTNIKFMVIPTGTANDFAKEMGTTNNIQRISKIFQAETTKRIDTINVNGRHMISNGGIGMASNVAKDVNTYRKSRPNFKKAMRLFGKNTYSLVYAQHMLLKPFQTQSIFIESKDSPLSDPRVSTSLVLINNQEFIGGNFKVAPKTKNDDGKFNVSIFTHKNRFNLLKCTLQMLSGSYPYADKELITFETDKLVMTSLDGKTLDFFGDGETYAPATILDISISPRSLDVFTYNGSPLHCTSYSLDQIEMIQ